MNQKAREKFKSFSLQVSFTGSGSMGEASCFVETYKFWGTGA